MLQLRRPGKDLPGGAVHEIMPVVQDKNDVWLLRRISLAGIYAAVAMVLRIVLAFAVVAALDYFYQWWDYERQLRMSKQEIKEEYKQTEGDPQIKGKIKENQRKMAQRRMMQQVPKACLGEGHGDGAQRRHRQQREGRAEDVLRACGLPDNVRGETLGIAEFAMIANAIVTDSKHSASKRAERMGVVM